MSRARRIDTTMQPIALIVDDSLTVRMDLEEAFVAAGFRPHPCASLGGARAALAEARPAVVVLDIVLPDGDGIAFLKELRQDATTADIPVLLLSSKSEVEDRIRGLKTGADEYVGKPYDRTHVVARSLELLRGRTPDKPSRSTPMILVVDDSPTFREELRRSLEEAGYGVLVAETGEEGLRLAEASRPDALIVDGRLPGISGAMVIQRLRLDSALRYTPCVLLTGSVEASDELLALESGADAFVQKTDEPALVLARLSAVLRSSGAPAGGATRSALGPRRVLAVDDSPSYLGVLCEQLQREGYDVVQARSGEQAIELLMMQDVDCVLLDLVMPGLSGQDTCRHIKNVPRLREIPLLMLTGRDDRESMIEGLNAGADDYIAKSSDFEVIKGRIRAQLRRKYFEDENRRIREELLHKELEASRARAAHELAETRARLLAAMERKNEELEAANRAKSQFLAGMSHELRTPLNAIIGFSDLLDQGIYGPISEEQREAVLDILGSGRHLLCLVNDILDLSKIEAGKMEVTLETTVLAPLVEAVSGALRALADKQGVALEVDLPPQLPLLHVDPVRTKQILYNLLSNGMKFTPAGGSVRLQVRPVGESVELIVSDTGIGIAPEDLSRLFGEFVQLHAPGSAKPEGTGLGLALTRRFVELQGGRIDVRSELDKGTVFTVTLPRADGAARALAGREMP
jgi:DNA-binding response OmpR family regulator/two-component sensor histidine kinase